MFYTWLWKNGKIIIELNSKEVIVKRYRYILNGCVLGQIKYAILDLYQEIISNLHITEKVQSE